MLFVRAAIVIAVGLAAGFLSWFVLDSNYRSDYFASEEARKSLEVTEAQTAELESSQFKTDAIAFGFAAALISLVGAAANPRSKTKSLPFAIALGIGLGLIAGGLGAVLGHTYDSNVPFPRDAMLYWFGRWALIALPICVACGLAAAAAGDFFSQAANGLTGALLGGIVAVLIYCLLCGAVSPIESRNAVFPTHSANRMIILLALATLPPLGAALALRVPGKPEQKR